MVSAKLFLCQICQMPTHKICVCVQSALYLTGKSSKHEGYLRQPAVVFRCLQENFFAVHLDRYDMVLLQQIITSLPTFPQEVDTSERYTKTAHVGPSIFFAQTDSNRLNKCELRFEMAIQDCVKFRANR